MKKPVLKIFRVPRKDGTKVELPRYGTEGAACFDLHCGNVEDVAIEPGKTVFIPSGIKVEIPEGWQMKIHVRSSTGAKREIILAHCTGTIDSDFRGEILLPLFNRGSSTFIVKPGDRLCQGELLPVYTTLFKEVDEEEGLSPTVRGVGGLGSTGK